MYKVATLSNGFMAASLLGFLIVLIYTLYGTLSVTWGVALGLLFIVMIISSLISIQYGPAEGSK